MRTGYYPLLYQINTRVGMTELSRVLERPASLDDIPDSELDRLRRLGVDWIWLLSVWQTGEAGREVSRQHAEWRKDFQETLPDLQESDIGGSGFAIQAYSTATALGGNAALSRLRNRLQQRGIRLMLDFVPNHSSLDHPWLDTHPEFYIHGSEDSLAHSPQNFIRRDTHQGSFILAHGRDPNYSGWPDTLQLNYGNAGLQQAMIGELLKIADLCDGVRCDMAMLILPDVFERTWGMSIPLFWPEAIRRVRRQHPDFLFMAEVYWDLEWLLQQQGFDYTYDKRLYDRLLDGQARPVREHLCAAADFQNHSARFLENHDEPRAAASFSKSGHQAAAIISFLTPGLRFFHEGQFEGRLKRISPHLIRSPVEPVNTEIQQFYQKLLSVLQQDIVRTGNWQLLECLPAWEGNWTADCFIAFAWQASDGRILFAAVNFSPNQAQCYVRLPFPDLWQGHWQFRDLMHDCAYDYPGGQLEKPGIYLDLSAYGYHVFEISRQGDSR